MKKSLLFFTILLIGRIVVSAQAYEDKIQYDKKKQAAIAIDYNYPPEAVENAMLSKFSKMGYKPKEQKGIFNPDKGFYEFKNAYVTDISKDRMDYVIKVERKSRKENDQATLYLIMIRNDENALERMEASSVGRAKSFLNDMLPDIEAAALELQITDQEENIVKAEKKLKQLQDEKLDLDKKITDNMKAQDDTIKDMETQKSNLQMLKGKRSKS